MSNAEIFISQIKNGDVTDAINTIKESLGLQLSEGIKTTRIEVLSNYGFSEKFEKEEDKKEESDDDSGDEEDEEDDKKPTNEKIKPNLSDDDIKKINKKNEEDKIIKDLKKKHGKEDK